MPKDIDLPALRERINAGIRTADKLRTVQHHFTLHAPRSIRGSVKVTCWCDRAPFLSALLDGSEFSRFVAWVNEHEDCQPKESA